MKRKITFPVIKGTNVRRNAETGIEITTEGQGDKFYAVAIPGSFGERYRFRRTLAEARAVAIVHAGLMRSDIAEAYDEALHSC